MGDWVRYKLDRQTDHILVDEAQDTNERQWNIVARARRSNISPGRARLGRHRTIFTVGDFKQAISASRAPIREASMSLAHWFARGAASDRRAISIDLSVDLSFRSRHRSWRWSIA